MTLNPAPGVYSLGQLIGMSTPTTGATIRYTTDGSTPSETNGTVYGGPVAFGANVTINAIAYKSGLSDSPITSGPYTIQNSWGGTPYVTNYTYDVLNHLIGVSMPRSSGTQTRTFVYNSGTTVGGMLLSATNPENGTVTYTYNTNHMLATKTDAKGQQFTYQYDSINRLTSITWQNAPGGPQALRTFIYDTNSLDGTFTANGTGRLVAVQNAQFTGTPGTMQLVEMFSYKPAGERDKKRLQIHENAQSLNLDATYTYDNEGRTASVSYPLGGNTYTYSFDSIHRPSTLTDQNNNQVVSSVQYNAANQILSMNYFTGSETRQYNSLGQLTSLVASGSSNLNLTYNYAPGFNIGKITSMTDNISGETVVYQYDSLNRLIAAAGSGWAEAYGYDSFGAWSPRRQQPARLPRFRLQPMQRTTR